MMEKVRSLFPAFKMKIYMLDGHRNPRTPIAKTPFLKEEENSGIPRDPWLLHRSRRRRRDHRRTLQQNGQEDTS